MLTPSSSGFRYWPILLGILWLAVIVWGLRIIWKYEITAGSSGAAPAQWPKDSRIPRALDHATLVMLAHPRCPCTRASVDELAWLMTRLQGRLQAHVIFYQPADQSDTWSETSLWRAAASISGVNVWRDKGSIEADRFRAKTSGHVVLYDPEGRLLFSGGITGLRGHVGDNVGRRAIVSLLTQGKADNARMPVLGCTLKGPTLAVGGRENERPIHGN